MGTSAAYMLSRMVDKRIVLLDRYGVGNDYGSSNDFNRVFRYSYGADEYYTKMASESRALWNQLEKETSEELLVQTGLLMLHGDDQNSNKFCESSFKTLNNLGLGANRCEGSDLERHFPQFRSARAVFDPHGGVLLASKSLKTLGVEAQRRGVKFEKKHVRKIQRKSRPEVELANGEVILANKVIVTSGSWTKNFLEKSLPSITPKRQQVIYLKTKRDFEKFKPESCPVFFTDHHYGLPAAGIDGVKISNKELNDPVDPDTAKRTVDGDQIEECRAACRKFVPDLASGDIVHSNVCIYDMTDNSDFVIDYDPEESSIVYGYGFSGHGFKFAPLIGRSLAELALDREPSFDLERFSAQGSRRQTGMTGGQLGKGE